MKPPIKNDANNNIILNQEHSTFPNVIFSLALFLDLKNYSSITNYDCIAKSFSFWFLVGWKACYTMNT